MLLYSYWERVFPHGSTEISCAASWVHSILSKLPWRWPKFLPTPMSVCFCIDVTVFAFLDVSSVWMQLRSREIQDWMNTWFWVKPSCFHLLRLSVSTPERCLQECLTDALRYHHVARMYNANQIHENQIKQFLTWSIAHGIRHWIFSLPLNICGNDELKDGAAWIAGKLILPKKYVWKS